jgi:hypothetical protein
MSLGTKLSAVVFRQHVHLIIIVVIFLLKENIDGKTANISAQLHPLERETCTCRGTAFSAHPVICEL